MRIIIIKMETVSKLMEKFPPTIIYMYPLFGAC